MKKYDVSGDDPPLEPELRDDFDDEGFDDVLAGFGSDATPDNERGRPASRGKRKGKGKKKSGKERSSSRPTSAARSRPASVARSRPGSAARSRPSSASPRRSASRASRSSRPGTAMSSRSAAGIRPTTPAVLSGDFGEEGKSASDAKAGTRCSAFCLQSALWVLLVAATAAAIGTGAFRLLSRDDCDENEIRNLTTTVTYNTTLVGNCKYADGQEALCREDTLLGTCCRETGVCWIDSVVNRRQSAKRFTDMCQLHTIGIRVHTCETATNCSLTCTPMHPRCSPRGSRSHCLGVASCKSGEGNCLDDVPRDTACIVAEHGEIHFCNEAVCPSETSAVVLDGIVACQTRAVDAGVCQSYIGGCCLTTGRCPFGSCEENNLAAASVCSGDCLQNYTCVPLRANCTIQKGGHCVGVLQCNATSIDACNSTVQGTFCFANSTEPEEFKVCDGSHFCPSNTVTRFSERGDVFCDPINATCTTLGECCLTTGLCPRHIADQCSAADSSLFVACPNATAGNCTAVACRHSRRNCQETRDGVTTCLGLTVNPTSADVDTDILGKVCFTTDAGEVRICHRQFCTDSEIISWGADENEAQCLNALAGCPTLGRRGQCCLRTSRCITGSCAANGLGNGTLTNASTPGRRVDCQLITPTCATESGYRYCLGYTVCRANHTCHYSEVDVPCVVTVEGDSRSAILSGTFDLCAQEEFCERLTAPRFFNGTLQCVAVSRHAICHPHEQLGRCCKMNGYCPGELCEANLLGQTVECTPTTCPKLRCLPLSPSHCGVIHDPYEYTHLGYVACEDPLSEACVNGSLGNAFGASCLLSDCANNTYFSLCANSTEYCPNNGLESAFRDDAVQCKHINTCRKIDRVGECCRPTGECMARSCVQALDARTLSCDGDSNCHGIRCIPIPRKGDNCTTDPARGIVACMGRVKCRDSETTCPAAFNENHLCLYTGPHIDEFVVCDVDIRICGVDISRSDSFTISETSTMTGTETASLTKTESVSESSSSTPSLSASLSATVSLSLTASSTLQPTASMTSSATLTTTMSGTMSISSTVAPSASETFSTSRSFTSTRTISLSVSLILTASVSASPTSTLLDTPTATASPTPTSSFTPTISRSLTGSASPTLSATVTAATPSATVTAGTPSSTLTAATPSATATATPSYTATAATPSPTVTGATPSVTVSAATPSSTLSGATPSATVTAATPSTTVTAATPSGTMTGATPSATLPATPSATTTATPSTTLDATPSGTASTTPSHTLTAATPSTTMTAATPSASLASTPSATATATPSATVDATPSATVTHSYSSSISRSYETPSGSLSGSVAPSPSKTKSPSISDTL